MKKERMDGSPYSDVRRFWENVNPAPWPMCWEWAGAVNEARGGYAYFRYQRRKHRAHRASYMMFCGPIPEGMVVRHDCDNPSCVAPYHLSIGTTAQNNHDKVVRNRTAYGERSPKAKITPGIVRQVRSATGLQREIGERFGITQSHVSSILLGKCWRRVV